MSMRDSQPLRTDITALGPVTGLRLPTLLWARNNYAVNQSAPHVRGGLLRPIGIEDNWLPEQHPGQIREVYSS